MLCCVFVLFWLSSSSSLYFVCSMLPVSRDCSLLISPSVFSNVYVIPYVVPNYDKKNTIRFFLNIMVLNATCNNISVISCRSFLYVEETWVPGENRRPAADKLYLIMLYRVHPAWAGFELTTLLVIGTDNIGTVAINTLPYDHDHDSYHPPPPLWAW